MSIKIYTGSGMPLPAPSTDEPKYAYETYFSPKDFDPNDLPGQYSSDRVARLVIENKVRPNPGTYPILVKVYFAKGRVAQAAFNIVIPPTQK
jgi:hypothetical protein